ncbi:RcnB family protein [Pseudomonas sp. NPDC096917]|uniref:RcnB family protein n=1 Tax=Pseudomonas sp. NPDC096917 TaxID=3364483 RepID=UPI00383B96B7
MTCKKQLAAISIGLLCSLSSLSYAADEPSVTLNRSGVGAEELKVGDVAPDEYQRESLEIKDWKKHKLQAPGEHEQWVEAKGKYMLISVPTGAIKEIVNK